MHKILRALILSDLLILGSFGLIQPIFAVFLLKNIGGITIISIGIATTIQLLTKAVFQIIVGKWADEEVGNKRELWALLVGSLIMSFVPIGYIFSTSLSHIYLLEFIYGLGNACAYPGWMVLFTRYARDDKAGYEWGLYNTVVSLGTATTAALGAYFVEYYSFTHLFLGVTIFSLIGTGFIFHIFRQEFTKVHPRHKLKRSARVRA